jgi:hypothetical protein
MSGDYQASEAESKTELAPGPLFVVSMWRSGSSLLYALLNKHAQVALMYEADLLLLRPVFQKPKALRDWAERWGFWNDIFRRHGLAEDVAKDISDFAGAFAAVHQSYARQHGASIWGDKSPNYYDRMNEMADAFPQARFIIVWRDPKGTANSILRAAALGNSFFSRKGAVHCGLLGYAVFKKECDKLIRRGVPVCQISYEDLNTETSTVMRTVCQFLQIPYDDSLSTLAGADRSAILDGQHHANLRGDTIVRGPRPELASNELSAKIDGYGARWRQRYGTEWPPYPPLAETSNQIPSLFSRLIDLIRYKIFRTRDRISPIVFSFIPISLLRRYRAAKQRRREASGTLQSGPVDSGGSSCATAVPIQAAPGEGRI